jgi:hypothetical protein
MKPKTVAILALVALLTSVAAGLALNNQRPALATVARGEKLFPGLADKASGISSVVLESGGRTMTFERTGKGGGAAWTLKESDGYAVEAAKRSGLIIRLGELELRQAKTKRRDRLAVLDLDDPSADSEAKRLRLLDAQGQVIAGLVIGKSKLGSSEAGRGIYLRRDGEDQAWLAQGEINADSAPDGWLVKGLFDVDRDRVARVSVKHPDGETIVVGKENAEQKDARLLNLPEGEAVREKATADAYLRPFDDFELRDARQAANKVLAVDKTISVEMTTFDGLTVKLAFVVEGDKAWATIAASGEKKEGAKDHDAVKEAAEINARGQGWVFEIPDWKVTTLKQRLADVIKKKDDKK